MKISFPHIGNLSIALSSALRLLGGEVLVPPQTSKRTLSLGSANSPEAICLPYKLILGNYIEAIEGGAEAVLMLDSPGICRLGQYSSSCRNALSDMGYDIKFINFDLYKGKLKEVYSGFKEATGNGNPIDLMQAINLALVKIDISDKIDRMLFYNRAREIKPGSSDSKHRKILRRLDNAVTPSECRQVLKFAKEQFSLVPIDADKEVLHVTLTGEIFVVLDSFSNMEIEKELGRMGVHVHRMLNLSDWTNTFLIPSFMRLCETHGQKAEKYAKDFLRRDIGGDALESVGDASFAGTVESDGVIHLLPFTCMPEIISQNILPNVVLKNDIPVLSLILDEQTGRAGYLTRLEAFVDLLARKNQKKIIKSVVV